MDLWAFYRRHERQNKRPLTRVGRITHKMIGSPTKPRCKLKAAESWGMLLFVLDRVGKDPSK
eukprot:11802859-Alexandrium_andersonii.AAC.1